ncbi:MAG: response regulator [Planctomycetes bacterium]|nr:response regulator [Planctomycetota bacterium]
MKTDQTASGKVGLPSSGGWEIDVADIRLAGIASLEILNRLPEGVAVLSPSKAIVWSNLCFNRWFGGVDRVGQDFYSALGHPEVQGSSPCPVQACIDHHQNTIATLKREPSETSAKPAYYQLNAVCISEPELARTQEVHQEPSSVDASRIVVTLRDITDEVLQEQKLAAIHQAGAKLTDLKPEEIFAMDVEQRIDLLKDNIRHYTQDLLNIEVIEIRLLEQSTGNLIPLLSVGIDQAAADRRLMASPSDNGVTGWVAANAMSYLCKDTLTDPMYLEAFKGARSSLTVPILLHEAVIGTINVESPKLAAFSESDQQFLEIFARDVAVSLNTLELLVAQRTNAAQQSCDAIHSAVSLPLDDLLLDAVFLMEKYIGHDPESVARLRSVLSKARSIKKSIQSIGQSLVPHDPATNHELSLHHAKLAGRRILVVDADESVRNDAHALLERYGCVVETAQSGDQAVAMVRSSDEKYDVIITDIKLPDYSGYQLMLRLQKILDHVPIALMTGFGYDPGHSIVKARQAGLHRKAILYKPFHLDQLLGVTELLIEERPETLGASSER